MTEPTHEYLVSYGLGGFLGRFRCAMPDFYPRDTRVIIRTLRGLEIGTILCGFDAPFATLSDLSEVGELCRIATSQDEEQALAHAERCQSLLADAQAVVDALGLPCSIIDGEVLHDGHHLILQYLAWASFDPTPLVTELGQRVRLEVQLSSLNDDPQHGREPQGCGKPNCGSGGGGCTSCGSEGGGCSTGSCSRGSVKNAAELTAYFAALRQKMESAR